MSTLLSRSKAPFKKQPEHIDMKYLLFAYPQFHHSRRQYGENGSDDDDTSSTLTMSTNATMDNIPGTGRTIDTYLYQFFGRKLERFIFRISMANISPDRIFRYLWKGTCLFNPIVHIPDREELERIARDEVSGLKSLIKQTQ